MSDETSASVTALLREAVGLHQQGRLDDARALYGRVLEMAPRQFDALHLSGVIAKQRGEPELAMHLIAQAIEVDPAHAAARCNLGAALQDLGRTEEALASYEQATGLDPKYALAFSNRGNALRKLGRLDEALGSYDRALAIRPNYPEAWCNRAMLLQDLGLAADALASAEQALAGRAQNAQAWVARGNALQGLERFEEAVESYDRALAIEPANAETHCARGTALKRLGRLDAALGGYEQAIALRPGYATAQHYRANTLRDLGCKEEAIAAYRDALSLGADQEQVSFALAALGVGEAPAGSPAAYVRDLFDQYAGHFDEHLVDKLEYRTPASLDAAIRRHVDVRGGEVLDLGCGTGLMGPYLRPMAGRLTGVDLSGKMLERARGRGVYDQLECGEIVEYLATRAEAFDLVAAADVLVYFGDLAPLLKRVHEALRPDGWICFSVERCEDADFVLRASNRFAHSLEYVRRCAGAAGFDVRETQEEMLRTENGAPVAGHLIVMRKRTTVG
jgi:predicted TPR repeat methyltransferase